MIWLKIKNKNAQKCTVYTTDVTVADELGMHLRRKGKYYYKVISAKWVKKALGYTPKLQRGRYMSMVHMYPPAAAYIKQQQPIPLEVKQEMEAYMEWNPETGTFNDQKRLDLK